MGDLGAAGRLAAVAALDVAAVLGLRPDLARLGAELTAPRTWALRIGVDGLLGDVGAAALWLVATWLLVALLAAWAAALPGAVGRVAARVGRGMLPAVVRRLVIGSAGLGVLLAPVAAGAVGTATHTGSVRTDRTTVSAGVAESPDDGIVTSTPTPRWPESPQSPTPQSPQPPKSPPTPIRTADTSKPDGAVTVQPGDSLWVIAQRRLGAHSTPRQVAEAWPRWYAANHAVVGNDPDHITPGQVLDAPSAGAPTAN